jgi:hypothetical protein
VPHICSFFARCGIPRYSTCNSLGVIRSATEAYALCKIEG